LSILILFNRFWNDLGQKSANVTVDAKWRTVLSSGDVKIADEAIAIAKKYIQIGESIPMFVKYATGTAGALSTNTLKAMTNDAAKDGIVKQFIDAGVPRLVNIVKETKDLAPVMRFLVNFLSSEGVVFAFLDAGGIEPILSFVFHAKDAESQKLGVSVLNNLTLVLPEKELDRLAHSKEWKILGNLLAVEDESVISLAVSVCAALCKSSKNKDYFLEYAVQPFTKLIHRNQLLRSNDKLCAAVLKFIARVCEGGKRVSPLVRAEGVYQLVSRSLVSSVGDVSAAALAALANMAAHEKAMLPLQKSIIQSAALPQLIKFVSSEHAILRLRSVWSLANLLIHPAIQVAAAELEAVDLLISTATNTKERLDVRVKSYTGLFHLSMRLDKMRSQLIVGGAFKQLPSLAKLDSEIVPLLLKALVNCSLVDDAASLLSQKKVLPEVIKLLSTGDDVIQSFSLLILENLCFSSSSSDLVHEAGALPALVSCATSSSGDAEAKSLQILANLAFSSKARKAFAASPDLGTKLKTLILNARKPQATRDGAALALHNLSIPVTLQPTSAPSADADDDFAEFMDLEFEDDGDLIEAAPVIMPSKIRVSPHRRSSRRNSDSSKSPSHERERSSSSSSSRALNRADALKPDVPKSRSKPSLENLEHDRSHSVSSDSPSRASSRRGSRLLAPDGESPKPLSREETVIQDMALKKDQYTINEAPGTPTKSKKKLSLAALLSRIKKKDSNNKLGDIVLSRSSSPVIASTPAQPQPVGTTDPVKLERAKQLFKRTRVAQELLQTEGNYVRDLAILIRKWMNPLFGLPSSVISPEDVRKIFSSVETIFSVNTLLLEGLNEKMVCPGVHA
jgi:hypothetical protein